MLISRIDVLIAHETDPVKLDKLASAQFKLAEQERILDGRPLPGGKKQKERQELPVGPQVPEVEVPEVSSPEVGDKAEANAEY